jgi:beta-lactamase class A
MTRRLWPIIFCALVLSACATIPVSLKLNPQNDSLAKRVSRMIQHAGCRMGVAAIDLKRGRTLEWNAEETFEAASVIKIAILAEALTRWQDGKLDLTQRWSLTDQAKAAGSGVLDSFDPGLQPTNLDLLRIMIIVSDNTAANHWIDELGYEAINRRMAAAGLPQIRLVGNRLPDMNPPETESDRWKGLRFGEVTPKAVADYYQLLYEGKLLNEEGTKVAREIFSQQHYTSRIPRLLLEKKDLKWEGKTGTLGDSILDSGILTTPNGSYALAIFADQIPDSKGASDKAVQAMGDIADEIVITWEREI